MRGLLLQLVFIIVSVGIVVHIAEAPLGFIVQEKTEKTVTLVFVGDIMLGRNVENLMNLRGKNYPFASTSEIFKDGDVVVANLEGPIPHNHVPTKNMEMSFSFPPYVPQLLYEHNVRIVSLANNHTYDKGAAVYTETVEALNSAGVSSFGHPVREDATYVGLYEIDGVKFALAGFNATFPTFDLERAIETVRTTKDRNPEAVLIVFMHWGDEYEIVSNKYQQEVAQALHDGGAEVVIGAHPHVVQETDCSDVERCTIYSLGNFIFDQYWNEEVETGMVAYLTLSNGKVENVEFAEINGGHSSPHLAPLQ